MSAFISLPFTVLCRLLFLLCCCCYCPLIFRLSMPIILKRIQLLLSLLLVVVIVLVVVVFVAATVVLLFLLWQLFLSSSSSFQPVFSELFKFRASTFSVIVLLKCLPRAIKCKSGSMKGLSVETVPGHRMYKIFLLDFQRIFHY